ncbi:MAG: nuclear transport factor 2 family protein [Phycisphaerales bacterium JB041]
MIAIPSPVERFFSGKNTRDPAAAVSGFSASAVVLDEGGRHEGPSAIRAWIERTTAEYNDRIRAVHVETAADVTEVVAEVSGTFPGSPAKLRFAFTLHDDLIDRLEIR